MSVQAPDALSWEPVQSLVEKLRKSTQGQASWSSCKPEHSVRQLKDAMQTAASEAQKSSVELQDASREARDLQSECEQLKMRLSLAREDRRTERRGMEEQGVTLTEELRRKEDRLRQAVREVNELRKEALHNGELEQWQVSRIEGLQRDIDSARQDASRNVARLQELRERLGVSRGQGHSKPSNKATLGPEPELREEGLRSVAAEELPWDSARHSIEQLRDRFQLAVQQARRTIEAS
mmetsp:Transcript_34686/g.75650  ORF Transcript_34686/g.75650 Transcript_34686/m.75650 type:complete len:237 (+) Transcript_34686:229-939(+)